MDKEKTSYIKRLPLSALFSFIFSFTILFYIPYEYLSLNQSSYNFTLQEATLPLVVLAIIVFVLMSLILPIFRGKAWKYISTVLVWFSLCGYIQSTYLNSNLGTLNGDAIVWTDMATQMVINTAIWLAVLILLIVLMNHFKQIWKYVVVFACVLVFIMQGTGLVSLIIENTSSSVEEQTSTDTSYLTSNHLADFSSNKNIVVFCLDRLDYDYFNNAINNDPSIKEGLKGFTSYVDCPTTYARTIIGANYLLTNYDKTAYKEPCEDFMVSSFNQDDTHIFKDLQDANYDIDVYDSVPDLLGRGSAFSDYIRNLSSNREKLDPVKLLSNIYSATVFKYLPLIAKPFFWSYTGDLNKGITDDEWDEHEETLNKVIDNFNTESDKPLFKFIHLIGSHAPYRLMEDGTPAGDDETATVETQTIGSLHITIKALEKMKELGIFDDATIIITADHASLSTDAEPTNGDTIPFMKEKRIAMLYKAPNQNDDFHESTAPVSQNNVPATIIRAAGLDYSSYGLCLDETNEANTKVRYAHKTLSEDGSSDEKEILTYEITGNSADFNNWKIIDTQPIEYKYY